MRRVTINERDVTVVDNQAIVTDVVYVPGFALGKTNGRDLDTAVAPHVPTYCENVTDFFNFFGADAPFFNQDQFYTGFEESAVPIDGESVTPATTVMFHKDDIDPSYIYALEILSSGLPVVYERMNENTNAYTQQEQEEGGETTTVTVPDPTYDVDLAHAYAQFALIFNASSSSLMDRNGISIKYLTSGGYPTFEYGEGSPLAKAMQMLAYSRGDCIAFIDHTNYPARPLTGESSVYTKVTGTASTASPLNTDAVGSYSTMITPWFNAALSNIYVDGTGQSSISSCMMPGSFAYLTALASSLKTNANWLAIAGVARGRVPHLLSMGTESVLTNTIAENMTPIYGEAINPITNIRPYGNTIWGNRTLLDTSSKTGYATGFLNIRNLVCDVKKQAYIAAMSCMFEQNTDVLWINFKSMIQPMLEQMRSGGGLKNYKIIKLPGSERETIRAKIVLVPVYAVEQFIIDIFITDSDVSLEEAEA